MLGRVHEVEPIRQPMRFGRWERFIQDARLVRIQVVEHQRNAGHALVHVVGQELEEGGEVGRRPPRGHVQRPPPQQRLTGHEQVRRPVPLVLVIHPCRLTRSRRDGVAGLINQLRRGLVHAHDGPVRVVWPLVDVQHLLHPADELGVLARRDDPLLDLPRLQVVFFIARPTVSAEIVSTTRSATSRSARSCSVHRARPAGGSEQASATSRASARPSNVRRLLGRSWGLRVSAPSRPRSTNRCRTLATVFSATSSAAAMAASDQAGPSSPWSALSRIRARANRSADARPPRIMAPGSARSSPDRVTRYTFRMTPPPEVEGVNMRNIRPKSTAMAHYCRMSTDKQEDSIDRQRSNVLPYAERKGYHVLPDSYDDSGIAGDEFERRAGLQRLLRDAAAGKFDVILCDEVSRLSRQKFTEFMAKVAYPLEQAGVTVDTV